MDVEIVQTGKYDGVYARGSAGCNEDSAQHHGVSKKLIGDEIASQRGDNKFDR